MLPGFVGIALLISVSTLTVLVAGVLILAYARRARARRELPGLADELGLKYHDPGSGVGKLDGIYRGHELNINGDSRSKILVREVAGTTGLVVSFEEVTEGDYRPFTFDDKILDSKFKAKLALSGVDHLRRDDGPRTPLSAFVERWGRTLAELEIRDGNISLAPKLGSSKPYFITREQVRSLLPDVMDLVEAFGQATPKRRTSGRSVFGAFKVAVVCPACEVKVALNGPVRSVHCGGCGESIAITAEGLAELFDDYLALGAGCGEGEAVELEFNDWQIPGLILQADCGAQRPRCLNCNEPLSVEEVDTGTDGEIQCVCGTVFDTFPSPGWLQLEYPKAEQFFRAERESTKSETSDVWFARFRF